MDRLGVAGLGRLRLHGLQRREACRGRIRSRADLGRILAGCAGALEARAFPASAWTGTELLVWGGWDLRGGFFDDGAAYDPVEGVWRSLPPAPIEARVPLSAWTGQELIVWGTGFRTRDRPRDGAAYNPVTDTWRPIAEGPIELTDATPMWTGQEMVVFGAALHGGNFPETETATGTAYDPSADSWRQIPPSESVDPNANTAVWAGDRLIAVDWDTDAEAYEPEIDRWKPLAPMPLDEGEDVPAAAYTDGWMLTTFFGQIAAFSSDTERWVDLTKAAPDGFTPRDPIVAEDVFLLFAVSPKDYEKAHYWRSGRPHESLVGNLRSHFVEPVSIARNDAWTLGAA